jgi:hypothetical protein
MKQNIINFAISALLLSLNSTVDKSANRSAGSVILNTNVFILSARISSRNPSLFNTYPSIISKKTGTVALRLNIRFSINIPLNFIMVISQP